MRALINALGSITHWLEKRFPERMTTGEVMARFVEFETRLAAVEQMKDRELGRVREEIAKLKILSGLQAITSVNGD